ncbi:MAG: hypothetical protein JXR19_11485 [Bacteroidia bacterium]
MNKNATLVLIFFILFMAGGAWFYLCHVKQVCSPTTEGDMQSLSSNIEESIVFEWESDLVLKGNAFSAMRTQLLNELQANHQLQIIGLYDPLENNQTGFINLGQARAQAVRQLFPEVSDLQVELGSEQTDLEEQNDYIKASRINIIFGHERTPHSNDTLEYKDS